MAHIDQEIRDALAEQSGGADALARFEYLLGIALRGKGEVYLTLERPPTPVPDRPAGPTYGHVADDMANQFAGGTSDGPIW